MTGPSTVDALSVDDLLGSGASGLLYFENFLPLLARVEAGRFPVPKQVAGRYFQQGGLDLGALGDDAEAVGRLADIAGAQLEELTNLDTLMQRRWTGPAGENAHAHLAADRVRAEVLVRSVQDAHQAMSAAVETLRAVVQDKAALVGGLDGSAIGGRTPAEIDAMISVAGIDCRQVDRSAVFPVLAMSNGDLAARIADGDVTDALAEELQFRCRDWVYSVFVPHVENTWLSTSDVFDATDRAVRETLTCVADAMAAVDDSEFPVVGDGVLSALADGNNVNPRSSAEWTGPPIEPEGPASVPAAASTAGSSMGDSNSPSRVSPSSVSPSSVSPSCAVPHPLAALPPQEPGEAADHRENMKERVDWTIAGAVENAIDDLSERIAERIAETLVPGLRGGDGGEGADSSVDWSDEQSDRPVSAYQQHPDRTFEPAVNTVDPRHDLPPAVPHDELTASGERGHVEAELDGHRARVALAHNGVLSLELHDPNGSARRFEIRMGPLGLPMIVEPAPQPDSVVTSPLDPPPVNVAPAPPMHVNDPIPEPDLAVDAGSATEGAVDAGSATDGAVGECAPSLAVENQRAAGSQPTAESRPDPDGIAVRDTPSPDAAPGPDAAPSPDLAPNPVSSGGGVTGATLSEAGPL